MSQCQSISHENNTIDLTNVNESTCTDDMEAENIRDRSNLKNL